MTGASKKKIFALTADTLVIPKKNVKLARASAINPVIINPKIKFKLNLLNKNISLVISIVMKKKTAFIR